MYAQCVISSEEPVIICISISGTPEISRIWPMPMMVGLSDELKAILIWPASVTIPCIEELPGGVTNPPIAKLTRLCPLKTPLVAVPSAHRVWSPIGMGLMVWLLLLVA